MISAIIIITGIVAMYTLAFWTRHTSRQVDAAIRESKRAIERERERGW